MVNELEVTRTSELACSVAPEELRVGEFVCVLKSVFQMVAGGPFSSELRKPEVITLQMVPTECDPPRKVLAINLPFVFVRRFDGKHEMLDVRRYKLARVTDAFARLVRKRLRTTGGSPKTEEAPTET